MTTLYTVDIGDYSDRKTIAIIDKHQKEIIERDGLLDGYTEVNNVRITPFELNEVRQMPAGHWPYTVKMYIDTGEVQYAEEACHYEFLDPKYYRVEHETEMDFIRTVAATDEKHAVKIVNEMRAQWKAETNWKPPAYN